MIEESGSESCVRELLGRASCDHSVAAVLPLAEGFTNRTYRVDYRSGGPSVVLRIYRDACSLQVETSALYDVRRTVPVPEVIYISSEDDVPPFVIMTFVPGMTFRQLRQTADAAAVAEASEDIGRTLAALRALLPDRTTAVATAQSLPSLFEQLLDSPLLAERIGSDLIYGASALIKAHAAELLVLDDSVSRIHGDFNNRNVLVAESGGRWRVSAIVDWESSRFGSPLYDVARFLQYEKSDQPSREPHFTRGYVAGGGVLPRQWWQTTRLINLVHQCQLLAEPAIPGAIVGEVRELIRCTVQGRNIKARPSPAGDGLEARPSGCISRPLDKDRNLKADSP